MGDAADDARDTEELWDAMRANHTANQALGVPCSDDCPFCDPEFEPLFHFQRRP